MKIGDRVVCVINGIRGVIIQTYTPNACEMQILVRTDDGRFYHAPYSIWKLEALKDGKE